MCPSPISTIAIRLMKEDDFLDAEQLLLAGYGGSPGRVAELERLLTIQPDGWFFACIGDQPVGMGGAVLYDRFAYIGMMVVLPAWQRQGIGRKIFEHILDWIERNKIPLALLDATEAGAALYRQYGFNEVDQACQYICVQSPTVSHPSPLVNLATMQDIPELAEFDRPLFGANRMRVFQTYLKDYPERFFIKRDEQGRIRGYLLAQSSRLGAWAALTSDDAFDLVEAALSLPFEGELNVIAPAANPSVAQLLAQLGFRFERALPHMASKNEYINRHRDLIYGQISFAIG
ncbi:MAG: GNAT family N-acetyltransferase [Anaerolineales bacterium]